tara:strand:- start:65 stop:928 length:864 start_codon:yes stop_codon:yes gene_type:complete
MILVDFNQICIANIMMQLKHVALLDEDMIRHMILNSLRANRQKFTEDFGELVICCDDRNYWRKDIFPYYKAHRRGDREKSPLDWNLIFETLNKVRDEIKETFPYKVIREDRAEADDIIASICHKYGQLGIKNSTAEPILILSSDKDFAQLQKYANVEQYAPSTKKWIRISNPERYLREHILRGDRGDGIPNFLSKDSCFVNGERQKPLSTKKVDAWASLDPSEFCDDLMLRNYSRNETLVNLDCVPETMQNSIIDQFDKYEEPSRRGLLNYFITNRLRNLTEHIGDF